MENYNYLLMDDNGANSATFNIRLFEGSIFEFENSTYEVASELEDGTIICNRL